MSSTAWHQWVTLMGTGAWHCRAPVGDTDGYRWVALQALVGSTDGHRWVVSQS
ncbi:unnamed protein product [Staurois parvus]|uniref:Uncharacterized protein n=1 Tax=Staurois parvus TaxID=386267 RepID=A0ABN9FDS1_9NEOB|nr:unnamed protein product [Staurois parvus]